MGQHCQRFVAWYDMSATRDRWVVIDIEHDDPKTVSGKMEMARVSNTEKARSIALELERGS